MLSARLKIVLTAKAKEHLAGEGFDTAYGARPLKRVIQNEIQNVLAMKILNGEIREGDSITIDAPGKAGEGLKFIIG